MKTFKYKDHVYRIVPQQHTGISLCRDCAFDPPMTGHPCPVWIDHQKGEVKRIPCGSVKSKNHKILIKDDEHMAEYVASMLEGTNE